MTLMRFQIALFLTTFDFNISITRAQISNNHLPASGEYVLKIS